MNPRPIHRSRLFCLGLPGLIFLLWLWLGIRDTQALFQWRIGHRHAIGFVTYTGILEFGWATVANPNTTSFSGPRRGWEITKTDPGPLFPTAVTVRSWELVPGFYRRNLVLAHWFLLLIYLLLWLTTTIAWHRRKRRLLTSSPAPAPSNP